MTSAFRAARESDEPRPRLLHLAESDTGELRPIDSPGVDEELRAARAELRGLRTELAELLNQVRRPDHHPDAPVSAPRPAPVTRPHVPLAAALRPAPATPSHPAPRTLPNALPAPAPSRFAPPAPAIGRGRPRPTGLRPPPMPAAAPAPDFPAALPSGLEAGYAAVLAEVLGIARVPVTSNFFDDLGADSMVMARFCARVRTRPELPNVAIKDIYQAPTIAALAAARATAATPARSPGRATADAPTGPRTPARPHSPRDLDPPTVPLPRLPGPHAPSHPRTAPVGTSRYLLCGTLQLLFLLGYPALLAYAFALGAEWVLSAATPFAVYLRAVQVVGALFLGTSLLPIVAKWLLVGRWKPAQFPVWSLRYFRFWLVKTLIRTNPLVRFVGSPLYLFYLRLLGAKIGKGATVLSPTVPVCTDLLTIGAGTIIRKASSFVCYRAAAGLIQVGPVTIGAGVLVGEATVLDIGSSLGDRSQLGHTSALHSGQSVPAGERWHGSPAEPTSVNYRAVPAVGGGALRKLLFSLAQLVVLFGIVLPLGMTGLTLLVREVPQVQALFANIDTGAALVPFLVDVVILSITLYLGGLLLGLLVMTTVPRVLAPLVRAGKVYRMYGSAYWALRTITRMTNSKFFTRVFGDSSYIVGYLRVLGYRFLRVEQTGSNFGTAVAHDTPFLCVIGTGTVVADGLTILNADYSNTSFKVSRVGIGAHSFLGNGIFYPARARVGNDCLLATKVMVPIDGPVRHGVGLLGSPSFEIPRWVERDSRLAVGPEQRRRGVAAKNRHNLVSIALLLLSRWFHFTLVVALGRYALDLHAQFGAVAIAAFGTANLLLTYTYFVLLDRTVRGLAAWKPHGVSIYDGAFWRHERYWKVAADTYIQRLNGTPLKNGLWRVLGVRVGRRLFDDGCLMTERVFVTIGDYCTLNERSVVQCHSQENDAFKSDRVVIGNGVTVGVGGFVHYGTRLGDGSVLDADSFLMKGEEIPPGTRWGGNPAVELDSAPYSINSSVRRKS